MTLSRLVSLRHGLDRRDVTQWFLLWLEYVNDTLCYEAFDVGQTSRAPGGSLAERANVKNASDFTCS